MFREVLLTGGRLHDSNRKFRFVGSLSRLSQIRIVRSPDPWVVSGCCSSNSLTQESAKKLFESAIAPMDITK